MAKLTNDVIALIDQTMRAYVAAPPTLAPPTDPKLLGWLDDLLSKTDTYRDGALILLAYPVANALPMDIRKKPDAHRSASQAVQRLLEGLGIQCRKDVFQTIAKGADTFTGRDRPAWNELLTWASTTASLDEITRAFHYMAASIAAKARNIPALPNLAVARLTFPAVVELFDVLLANASGGAFEQFILAALHDALARASADRRVETKTLNGADASAGTAGDVQIRDTGGVAEAFEISANDWKTKIDQAIDMKTRKQVDRVAIIAGGTMATGAQIRAALVQAHQPDTLDISVLDVAHELRSLVHRLRPTGREAAIQKLYEHLRDRQPNESLVRLLVDQVNALKLVEA